MTPAPPSRAVLLEEVRAEQARGRARRRRLVRGGLAVATVVGLTVAGLLVQQNRGRSSDIVAPEVLPAGTGSDWSGVETSQGPVRVDVYLDFLCPSCQALEAQIDPVLAQLSAQDAIQLVHHPVAMLDEYSSPQGYSTRAAAAAGCAADAGRFTEFARSLYAAQPPERGPGLSDPQLIDLAVAAGADRVAVQTCVSSGRYREWVARGTAQAYAGGVIGTPTVRVDGRRQQLDVDRAGEQLRRAVADAAR